MCQAGHAILEVETTSATPSDIVKRETVVSRDQAEQRAELESDIWNTCALSQLRRLPAKTPNDPIDNPTNRDSEEKFTECDERSD